MAQAVVSVALETIRILVVDELKFQYGVRNHVEEIKATLTWMRCFLKDADVRTRYYEDAIVQNQTAEVREAAYDIEDTIVKYFAIRAQSRRRRNSVNLMKRFLCLCNEMLATRRVGNQILTLKNKINGLTTSLQAYGERVVSDVESPRKGCEIKHELRRTYSHGIDDDFVGLEKDIEMLADHLLDEHHYEVVSIWGMGGLGKTTIARKLYSHRDVRCHFDDFAWTCISQKWEKKDILQGILIKLVPEKRDQIISMRDEELVRQLYEVLVTKKCLVVLDDIWSTQTWDALKSAFPTLSTGSKILLTTRNKEVALHVNPRGFLYKPRFLEDEESWELLQKKAFHRQDHRGYMVDQDMEKLGREIVRYCCGLPLAIVVLGGLLAKRHTLGQWQMVQQNINWYLAKGEGHEKEAVTGILAFSYHDLPYKFKQCFLSLAHFPEDCEINAEKLYQLWLAEDMVSSEDRAEEETMMDVAERYLTELAQRCMVQVRLKETTGAFKTCRLHDLMRDLCLSKVKEENFNKILDLRREKIPIDCSYTSTGIVRRVSIYVDSSTITLYPPEDANRIRSVFIYSYDCSGKLWQQTVLNCFIGYKMLRVLDLQGFHDADQLPKGIGELVHLRYLSLRNSEFKKLPSSLGKLKYLQTLDLEMRGIISVQMPNVLWKMEKLRHVYLPPHFHTEDNAKLRFDGLSNLETLINFDTSLCDVTDLQDLRNLRKLRTRMKEKLEDLPMIINYLSFTSIRLRRFSLAVHSQEFSSKDGPSCTLRQLLGCHCLNKLYISGCIDKLPNFCYFSPSLTKLSLENSHLEEDPMSILERLPNISSLTFLNSSFVGEKMVCSASGFPQLKYLKLWSLVNLERLQISQGAMPNLCRLVIAYCERLETLPNGLQSISALHKLNVRWMPEVFKNRLRVVNGVEGEDFHKVRHVPEIKLD
ncbi:hypothetical protein ACH5RR_031989 [Cinchona calisaya]|uniref:Uncharacterized protein n=1 Tax=Cinchona calisaya TaxID=153742 RepID=A0ABD2YGT7_9GENT